MYELGISEIDSERIRERNEYERQKKEIIRQKELDDMRYQRELWCWRIFGVFCCLTSLFVIILLFVFFIIAVNTLIETIVVGMFGQDVYNKNFPTCPKRNCL